MSSLLRNWRRRRALTRAPIPDDLWGEAVRTSALLEGLGPTERQRLREQATQFQAEKRFFGAHGLEITPRMTLRIALEACLPILELDLDWYDQWTSIIVYSDDFVPRHEVMDESGILHVEEAPYSGEAWERGPVVLSWGALERGETLAIHEFTHTLDMRNGAANGMPPLHRDMSPGDWTRIMTTAYDDLSQRSDHTPFDPYATQDPPEFFAVMSEYFFARPHLLADHYPGVYRQFKRFFRQDPLARLPRNGDDPYRRASG
ncbi:MAG: zinc-dependent peptidase [Ectothiorhodospira sp.]